MITDKYSHDQQREAVRAAKARRLAGGTVKDLPVWMQEANREYYSKYGVTRPPRNRNSDLVYRTALPEDKIIDWFAVNLAASGTRVVNLTYTERILAVARMLKDGLRPVDMSIRLGVHNKTVNRIIFQIRHNDAEQKILKALDNQKYEVSAVA